MSQCSCSTRWRQKDKYGSAKIKLGSSDIFPPNPVTPPPPPVPINIGGGSWAFVRNNPYLSISDGTSLASNEHIVSENHTAPFAVKGWCQGSGGSSCECINTNNGSGSLIDTQPEPNEEVPDSTIAPIYKDGKWVYTWSSTGQTTNGPDATETIVVKVQYTVEVKLNKYCHEHTCPDGAGSSSTNNFGNLTSWKVSMEGAGNALVSSASD